MSDTRKKQGFRRYGSQAIGEIASSILNPVIERRAGMTIDLIAAWPEIAGEQHAQYSQPHKLAWPSHVEAHEEFKPATLVIICEGARSIYLMHDSTAVIERVNAYFGFVAVDRLQVKQVAVKDLPRSKMPPPPALGAKDEQRLSRMLDHVEDDELRQSLSRMGRGIFSERSQ